MSSYVRPTIIGPEFRDAAGNVIPYGRRWALGSAPEDIYSVTSNLERLRPLHAVAEALIAHLVETYEVDVSDDLVNASDIMHTRDDIVRAVRLTPRNTNAAPLTFVFTEYPSVIVHAGVLTDFLFPVCGCDACDDAWEDVAAEMEWQILAVAAGGLSETLSRGRRPRYVSKVQADTGSIGSSGKIGPPTESTKLVRHARARLKALTNGWVAWQLT